MRLLTIGGTRFSGRALTGLALERGHEVTVFHRGVAGAEDPWRDAEHVHGDRAEGFGALTGRSFDAVVDLCGFFPRQLREGAAAFPGVGRYVFISSLSAHRDDVRAGATEDDDVHGPPFPDTEEITWETYGPLKVASERALIDSFGDRATVIRPGYIVGPHDPTDRFTYWARRAARGGEVLAPAPAGQPLQWVDARDLAAFVLGLVERNVSGTFSVVTPPGRHTLAELLATSAAARGADLSPTYVDDAFVRARELVASESSDPFPLITPDEPNVHRFDTSRAEAAGLKCRPLADTVWDTLDWDDARGAPWPLAVGLSSEREAELLSAWHGSS
jgi:2'-hydroxyisoflavone reductase